MKTINDDKYVVRRGNSTFRCLALAGCATSGKTFAAGLFASAWWAVDPLNSIVILTSTTKEMIRRRVWPIVQQHAHSAQDAVTGQKLIMGHLLEGNKTTLQAERGNDKHAIFAQAVAQGETSKAVENIKGQHAPRILIVVDEATGTPEAILQTIPNLRKSCQEFIIIVIGNPVSPLDPHGRICEPANGWESVTVDSQSWRTAGVPEWQIEPGVCLHFGSPPIVTGKPAATLAIVSTHHF